MKERIKIISFGLAMLIAGLAWWSYAIKHFSLLLMDL